MIAIGTAVWWTWPTETRRPSRYRRPRHEPANRPSHRHTPAPRLSIVVLPFTNLSNDPEQEYFADGITDDLTTDLSRIADSFVIARNTAFTYKGKSLDAKEVARELGVRYVLEGSVRRAGEQVQINAQLIDANSGTHVWADRFDTDRRNMVGGSERDHRSPARTLGLELIHAARRRSSWKKRSIPMRAI